MSNSYRGRKEGKKSQIQLFQGYINLVSWFFLNMSVHKCKRVKKPLLCNWTDNYKSAEYSWSVPLVFVSEGGIPVC